MYMPLDLQRNATVEPQEHWAIWDGGRPCDAEGLRIRHLLAPPDNPTAIQLQTHGLKLFSRTAPYADYYDKVTAYLVRIAVEVDRYRERE